MKHKYTDSSYWRGVNPTEIVSLKAESNYTFIYFKNGKSLLVSKCLKELEEKLSLVCDSQYLRISRSTIVNIQYISNASFHLGNSHITLMNNNEVAISRRKRLIIKSKMEQINYNMS